MYFVKGLVIVAIIAIMTYLTGKIWRRETSVLETMLLGFATELAVFNVLCIPMNLTQTSFVVLCACFGSFLGLVIVINVYLFLTGKATYPLIGNWKEKGLHLPKMSFHWMLIPALLIILYEMYNMVFLQPLAYGDDTVYMTMVNDIRETNIIHGLNNGSNDYIDISGVSYKYLLTSYYPFLAFWSKICHFHPLLLCKTFLPIFYLILGYGVFWLYAEFFFKDDIEKKSIFFFVITLLVEFGNVVNHSFSRRMLLWNWNNKSVLYTILIPFLIYLAMKYMQEEKFTWLEAGILGTVLMANGSLTLMGVVFSSIALGCMGLVMVIQKREIRILLKTIVAMAPTTFIMALAILISKGILHV